MIKRPVTHWHREVTSVDNEPLGLNGIFEAINVKGQFVKLMEEIDKNPNLLISLYISKRRPPSDETSDYPCWINLINRSEYVNNDIVLFTPGGRRIAVSCNNDKLVQNINNVLKKKCKGPDLAEVNLAARLLSIPENHITSSDRLIGLQGGIGCGKSTLLRHFFFNALPEISSELGKPKYIPAYADLLEFARYRKMSKNDIVKALLKGLRLSVPKLFGPDMRLKVASEGDLDFKETIESLRKLGHAKEAQEQIAKRIIEYTKNPVLHLKDISAFYGRNEAEQLVLIIDNVDHHTQPNQLRAIEFLWEMLVSDCPHSFGVLALREPTLCCIEVQDFIETRYLRTMHMTSIYICDMIKARLAHRGIQLSDDGTIPTVNIHKPGDKATLKRLEFASYKEFLDKWGNTFANQKVAKMFRSLYNNNMRDVLDGTVRVISSRHLNIIKLLSEFYKSSDYNPVIYGKPWESTISTDEIIRLLMLQSFSFYNSDKKDAIYNIFNNSMNPSEDKHHNRVPCLLKIRIFDAIRYSVGKGLGKNNIIKYGNSLGFSTKEMNAILSELLQQRLVESVEGVVISRINRLYCTPKGSCFAWLLKTVIYLEHIIGDTYINYKEKLRKPYDPFDIDFMKVLTFIDFIRERECEELRFAKDRGKDCYRTCMVLINMYPLCFRLLISVCNRAKSIEFWETHRISKELRIAKWLRDKIFKQAEQEQLGGHYVKHQWENLFNQATSL
ncbi:MAG: hypothetical protein ACYSWZ_11380 [Planctomycetota bacterium]|jgi:hypothetical protein